MTFLSPKTKINIFFVLRLLNRLASDCLFFIVSISVREWNYYCFLFRIQICDSRFFILFFLQIFCVPLSFPCRWNSLVFHSKDIKINKFDGESENIQMKLTVPKRQKLLNQWRTTFAATAKSRSCRLGQSILSISHSAAAVAHVASVKWITHRNRSHDLIEPIMTTSSSFRTQFENEKCSLTADMLINKFNSRCYRLVDSLVWLSQLISRLHCDAVLRRAIINQRFNCDKISDCRTRESIESHGYRILWRSERGAWHRTFDALWFTWF